MYKFIDANKEHLHTLDDKPLICTTTLLKEVHPPMLSWYGSGKALEIFGWLKATESTEDERLKSVAGPLQKLQEMPVQDFLVLLDKAYRNHDEYKKQQGKKGTDIHELVENYILHCIQKNGGAPAESKTEAIKDFVIWAKENVKKFLWAEGYCYSERLWVGGCADFGFIGMDDKVYIGDLKTAKAIYWTNFLQVAGYGIQAKENGVFTADGEKLGHPKTINGYMIFQQKPGGKSQVKWQFNVEELEKIFETDVLSYKLIKIFK